MLSWHERSSQTMALPGAAHETRLLLRQSFYSPRTTSMKGSGRPFEEIS